MNKLQQPSPTFLKLQSIVSEVTGVDPEDITPGMDLEEVLQSPLDWSSFFSHVKQQLQVPVSMADVEESPTLGQLADYIEDEMD